MVDIKKFSEIDLYQLFGVEFEATETEVLLEKFIIFRIHLLIFLI